MTTIAAAQGFSFAIRWDDSRDHHIAFINWVGPDGESILAGVLTGFEDEGALRFASSAVVDTFNQLWPPAV